MLTAGTSLAQFPMPGQQPPAMPGIIQGQNAGKSDPTIMQAPQIVFPQGGESLDDPAEVDFSQPVTFSWMACTNPSGAPVIFYYTLMAYPVMPGRSMDQALNYSEPTLVVDNLTTPMYVYNLPPTSLNQHFQEGQLYVIVVKARPMVATPQTPPMANGGVSPMVVIKPILPSSTLSTDQPINQ